jgi:hypothetical protein
VKTVRQIVLTAIVLAGSLNAQDRWSTNKVEPNATSSGHQIALGVGYRLVSDDWKTVDAEPTISGQYLWYASSKFALKVDLGFNHRTDVSSNSYAQTVSVGFGMRLQPSVVSHMPQPFWTPFLEFDFSTLRYDGRLGSGDFSETRLGYGLAVGLSLKIEKAAAIDVILHHVFNYAEGQPYYASAPSILPQPRDFPKFWCGFGGSSATGLYNPTNLIVRYRVAL